MAFIFKLKSRILLLPFKPKLPVSLKFVRNFGERFQFAKQTTITAPKIQFI